MFNGDAKSLTRSDLNSIPGVLIVTEPSCSTHSMTIVNTVNFEHTAKSVMPRTFFWLVAVQFISTLADNAFLIVAIARLMELGEAVWLVPVLKISATFFYVLLAPFVGPLSDAFPKGRVMLLSNILKVVGICTLLAGLDPLLAIAIVGLGSAAYAPAKYGLITELLAARELVRANGFFEGATVCAVIFGTVLGGLLVGPWTPTLLLNTQTAVASVQSSSLFFGMLIVLALHGLATIISAVITDNGARYPSHSIHPIKLISSFYYQNLLLWRDPLGGLSMAVTTLLWAVGATLQLIVLRWANETLGLSLSQAAYLQGVTALGVITGAVLASRLVQLNQAVRLLPIGLLLGALLPMMLIVHSVFAAAVLLVVVGAMAGFFVVPMNALLQHRGCTLLTAGRSIAVQGFNENAGMLLMLALYAGAIALNVELAHLIWGFSVAVVAGMLLVYKWSKKIRAQPKS
jgi:MFS family permease